MDGKEVKPTSEYVKIPDVPICRICYGESRDEPLISPCACVGSMAHVHETCLRVWMAKKNKPSTCEICLTKYRLPTRRYRHCCFNLWSFYLCA